MTLWWLFPLALATAWLLTGLLRRYALARGVMDLPNQRSSHVAPTPRGGGAAVVLVVLASLPLLQAAGLLELPLSRALAGAGGLVALVGWWDDRGHVPAGWRLLAHFAAAGWALLWLGGPPPLLLQIGPGWLGYGLAVFYLVWLLNLYNFMDGIDGIAGLEALTVCLGAVLLVRLAVPGAVAWPLPLLAAAATTGFLFWNFPKARIFMGDVGSGFVGLLLGVLSLHGGWLAPELFWGWLILLGVFIVDATTTLLRRLLRGEKVYQAHRSHAYQEAARRCKAHVPVSLAVAAINICWLLPLAALVATSSLTPILGLFLAYAPLFLLALHFRAGVPESRAG